MKKAIFAIITILATILMLSSCDSSNYKKAEKLMAEENYSEAAVIYDELGDYEDSKEKAADAKEKLMLQTYSEQLNALYSTIWFKNGDDDEEAANSIESYKFENLSGTSLYVINDGNGKNKFPEENFTFIIDNENITIKKKTKEIKIPYTFTDGKLTLEEGKYLSKEDVEKGLEGYWRIRNSLLVLGRISTRDITYYYTGDKVQVESASPGWNLPDDEYYYYEPKTFDCEINETGLVAEEEIINFSIVDAKPVLVHAEHKCERSDGFPGKDGYSF